MKINLNDLSEEPRQYSGEEPADILGITEDRDVNVRGPVAYAFRVYVVSGVLIVRGTLQAPMAFRCSRCGKFYDADIRESGYELIFELPGQHKPSARSQKQAKQRKRADSGEPQTGDRDSATVHVEKGTEFVDLTDDIRESILLNFPGYPLCSTECRGCCPLCGQDLNTGPCTCKPANDGRWGILDQLEVKNKE